MRSVAAAAVIVACCVPVSAQEPQPASPVSVEAIRAALQRSPQPPLVFRDVIPPPEFRPRRFGVVTFIPPATRSQFVNVSIPVGELTMRALRAFSKAQHRRAERAAERHVLDDMRAYRVRQRRP